MFLAVVDGLVAAVRAAVFVLVAQLVYGLCVAALFFGAVWLLSGRFPFGP